MYNKSYINQILNPCGMSGSFPDGSVIKESTSQCRRHRKWEFSPWVRKIPWRRKWQPAPILLPGKSHGQRCVVGYKELDVAEWLSSSTSMVCQTLYLRLKKQWLENTHTHTHTQCGFLSGIWLNVIMNIFVQIFLHFLNCFF